MNLRVMSLRESGYLLNGRETLLEKWNASQVYDVSFAGGGREITDFVRILLVHDEFLF